MYLCEIVEAEEVVNNCCRQIPRDRKIETVRPSGAIWASAVIRP